MYKRQALDYIRQLSKIAFTNDKITIIVIDDPHLLEAVSLVKDKLKCQVELIFSFHGFNLLLDPKIISSIDKILWLSKLGSEKSKSKYQYFPESYVVGNAIDSKIFYPLDKEGYMAARTAKGYRDTDEVLIWMANDRPKKGFHIFKSVVENLLEINKNLKVIIIGSFQKINHDRVQSIGKIPNNKVANYLQIGNYYMFTTLYEEGFGLSVVEALKCGNIVMASNKGALPEVLEGLKHSYLIDKPEDVYSWIKCFNFIKKNSPFNRENISKNYTDTIWNYQDWEQKFMKAIG